MSIENFDWRGYLQYAGYPENEIPESLTPEELMQVRRHWANTVYQEELAAAQQNPWLETAKERRDYARDSLLAIAPEFKKDFGLKEERTAEQAFSADEFRDWVMNNPHQTEDLEYYLKTFAASRINSDTKHVYPFLEGLSKKDFQEMFMEQNGLDEVSTVEDIRNGNFGPVYLARRKEEDDNMPRGSAWKQGWLEFKKLTGLTTETFGDFLGLEWMHNIGEAIKENAINQVEEYQYRSKYQESLVDTFKNEGIFAAAGKILTSAQENWATTGVPLGLAMMSAMFGIAGRNPRLAAQSLAAARGSLAAATANAAGTGAAEAVGRLGARTIAKSLAFASALSSGLEVGGVREELEEKGLYDPNDPSDAVAWGLLSASLDHIGNMATFIGGGGLVRAAKGFVSSAEARMAMAAEAAARQAAKELGKSYPRKIVESMGWEGITEALQELPAIMAAKNKGAEYNPKEIRDRMIDAGAVGAFMGGTTRGFQALTERRPRSADTETQAQPQPSSDVPPPDPNQPPPPGINTPWNTNFAEVGEEKEGTKGWVAWDGYHVGRGKTKEEAAQNLIDVSNVGKDTITSKAVDNGSEATVSFGNGGELVVVGEDAATRKRIIDQLISLHNAGDNAVVFEGNRQHVFDAKALKSLSKENFEKEVVHKGKTQQQDTRAVRTANDQDVELDIDFGTGSAVARVQINDQLKANLAQKGFRFLSSRIVNDTQTIHLFRDGHVYTLELITSGDRVVSTLKADTWIGSRGQKVQIDRGLALQEHRNTDPTGVRKVVKDKVTITPGLYEESLQIQRNAKGEASFVKSKALEDYIKGRGGKIDNVKEHSISFEIAGDKMNIDLQADGTVVVSKNGKFLGSYAFSGSAIAGGIELATYDFRDSITSVPRFSVQEIEEKYGYTNGAKNPKTNVVFVKDLENNDYYIIRVDKNGNVSREIIPYDPNGFLGRLEALESMHTIEDVRNVYASQFYSGYVELVLDPTSGAVIGFADSNGFPTQDINNIHLMTASEVSASGISADRIVKIAALSQYMSNGSPVTGGNIIDWVRLDDEAGVADFIERAKGYGASIAEGANQKGVDWNGPGSFNADRGAFGRYDIYGDDLSFDIENFYESFRKDRKGLRADLKKVRKAFDNLINEMKNTVKNNKYLTRQERKNLNAAIASIEASFSQLNPKINPGSFDVLRDRGLDIRKQYYRARLFQAKLQIDMLMVNFYGSRVETEYNKLKDYDPAWTVSETRSAAMDAEVFAVRLEEEFLRLHEMQVATSYERAIWDILYPGKTDKGYESFIERVHTQGRDIRFSRDVSAPRVRRTRNLIDELMNHPHAGVGTINQLMREGTLVVLPTQEHAEEIIRQIYANPNFTGNGNIQGFYHEGVVYLVQDAIEDGHGFNVFLHEFGLHARYLGFKGAEFQQILESIKERVRAYKNGEVTDLDSRRFAQAYDAAIAANEDPNNAHFWEEVAAYALEGRYDFAGQGLFDQLQAWAKRWLFTNGYIDASNFHYQDFAIYARGMQKDSGPRRLFNGKYNYRQHANPAQDARIFVREYLTDEKVRELGYDRADVENMMVAYLTGNVKALVHVNAYLPEEREFLSHFPDLMEKWNDFYKDNTIDSLPSLREADALRGVVKFSRISTEAARRLDVSDPRGATTRMMEFDLALQMEAEGRPEAEIKLMTNWTKGNDGLWGYEVVDKDMTFEIPGLVDLKNEVEELSLPKDEFEKQLRKKTIDEIYQKYFPGAPFNFSHLLFKEHYGLLEQFLRYRRKDFLGMGDINVFRSELIREILEKTGQTDVEYVNKYGKKGTIFEGYSDRYWPLAIQEYEHTLELLNDETLTEEELIAKLEQESGRIVDKYRLVFQEQNKETDNRLLGVDKLVEKQFSENVKRIKELEKEIDSLYETKRNLSDILNHPELFNAYPELNNVQINFESMWPWEFGYMNEEQNSDGTSSFEIVLNKNLDEESMKSTLIHEVQHVIQALSGFARGGNTRMFEDTAHLQKVKALKLESKLARISAALSLRRLLRDHVITGYLSSDLYSNSVGEQGEFTDTFYIKNEPVRNFAEFRNVLTLNEELLPTLKEQVGETFYAYLKENHPSLLKTAETEYNEAQQRKLRADNEYRELTDEPFQKYRRLMGELEARVTQHRLEMTEEERRNTPISETERQFEDIEKEDLIDPASLKNVADSPEGRALQFSRRIDYENREAIRNDREALSQHILFSLKTDLFRAFGDEGVLRGVGEKYWGDLEESLKNAKTREDVREILEKLNPKLKEKFAERTVSISRNTVRNELALLPEMDLIDIFAEVNKGKKKTQFIERKKNVEEYSDPEIDEIKKHFDNLMRKKGDNIVEGWETLVKGYVPHEPELLFNYEHFDIDRLEGLTQEEKEEFRDFKFDVEHEYLMWMSLIRFGKNDSYGVPIECFPVYALRAFREFGKKGVWREKDFYDIYVSEILKDLFAENVIYIEAETPGGISGRWTKILKGSQNEKGDDNSVLRCRAASHGNGWCTRIDGARKVVTSDQITPRIKGDNHDFWVFFRDGDKKASLALVPIRADESPQVLKNNPGYTGIFNRNNPIDNSVPDPLKSVVEQLAKKSNDADVTRTLKLLQYDGLSEEEKKARREEWFRTNTKITKDNIDEFRILFDFNLFYNNKNQLVYNYDQTSYEDFVNTQDNYLGSLNVIFSSVDVFHVANELDSFVFNEAFDYSNLKQIENVVGGNVYIKGGNFPNLQTIEGSIKFDINEDITIPNLKFMKGNLKFISNKGKLFLPELDVVNGNIEINENIITPNLSVVDGQLTITSPLELKNLRTVLDLSIRAKDVKLPSLETIRILAVKEDIALNSINSCKYIDISSDVTLSFNHFSADDCDINGGPGSTILGVSRARNVGFSASVHKQSNRTAKIPDLESANDIIIEYIMVDFSNLKNITEDLMVIETNLSAPALEKVGGEIIIVGDVDFIAPKLENTEIIKRNTTKENQPRFSRRVEDTFEEGTPILNAPGMYKMPNRTINIHYDEVPPGLEKETTIYASVAISDVAKGEPGLADLQATLQADEMLRESLLADLSSRGIEATPEKEFLYAVRNVLETRDPEDPVYQKVVDVFHDVVAKATGGAQEDIALTNNDIAAAAHALADDRFEPLATQPTDTLPTPKETVFDRLEANRDMLDTRTALAMEMVEPDELGRPIIRFSMGIDFHLDGDTVNDQDLRSQLEKVVNSTHQWSELDGFYNQLAQAQQTGTQEVRDYGDLARPADANQQLVNDFIASLPAHIADKIQVEWVNTPDAQQNLAGGLASFDPTGGTADKLIYVQGWGRTLGQVMRSVAWEVSRFGWSLGVVSQMNPALENFYDLHEAIIYRELSPYYMQRGINRATVQPLDKRFLAQTYFAKMNQDIFTGNPNALANQIGIDPVEYKKIHDEIKNGTSAYVANLSNIIRNRVSLSDPAMAKAFSEDLLRVILGGMHGRGANFVYDTKSSVGAPSGQIYCYTNDFGIQRKYVPTSQGDNRYSRIREEIKKNIEWWETKFPAFGRAFCLWFLRNFPMHNGLSFIHLNVPSARLGDTTITKATNLISRIWQRVDDPHGIEIRKNLDLMKEIHMILRNHKFDPKIAQNAVNGYEALFRSLGITGERELNRAKLADTVLPDLVRMIGDNARTIRSIFAETIDFVQRRMEEEGTISEQEIGAAIDRLNNYAESFLDDYEHRTYEAYSVDGLDELIAMEHDVNLDPSTGELTIHEKARQAEKFINDTAARIGSRNAEFYRVTEEARNIVRRRDRLDALRRYKEGKLLESGLHLNGAQLNEKVLSQMKEEIEARIADLRDTKKKAKTYKHFNNIPGAKKRKLDERLTLDREYMTFLGKVEDPLMNALYSIEQQKTIIEKLYFNLEFGEHILSSGMGNIKGGVVTDQGASVANIAEMERGTLLEYIRVNELFWGELQKEYELNTKVRDSAWGGIIDVWKANNTIYSLRLGINNYVGNMSMLLASGHLFRIGNYFAAGQVTKRQFLERFTDNVPNLDDFAKIIYDEMRNNRVVGGTMSEMNVMAYGRGHHEKFLHLFMDFLKECNIASDKGQFVVENTVNNFLEKMKQFYAFGDEWVKPLMYMNNRMNAIAKYKSQLDPARFPTRELWKAEVERKAIVEAAEQTIRESVSWENSPSMIRALSQKNLRLFAPDFLMHNFQMLRITASNFTRLFSAIGELSNLEVRNERDAAYQDALVKEIVQRSFGGAMTATVYAGLAGATGSVMAFVPYMVNVLLKGIEGEGGGDDDDKGMFFDPQEWEGAQRLMNYKTGGNNLFVPVFRKGDKIYAWNYVRSSVMLTHAPVRPPVDNPDFVDYAGVMFKNVVDLSNGTMTQQLINNMMGKDRNGREIGYLAGWGRVIEQTFMPGFARQLAGVTLGYPPTDNLFHEGRLIKIPDLLGISVNAYDPRDIANQLGWDISAHNGNGKNIARRNFMDRLMKSNELSDSQVADMVSDMRARNAKDLDNAHYVLTGLRQVGMTDGEIFTWLTNNRKSGGIVLGKDEALRFIRGRDVYDESLVTSLVNRRKQLIQDAKKNRMSKEELSVVVGNFDRAIRMYQESLRAQ